MKVYNNPSRSTWADLSKRATLTKLSLDEKVNEILARVKRDGDQALFAFTKQFDQVELDELAVSASKIAAASILVETALRKAIDLAKQNIEKFHTAQKEEPAIVETMPGVSCWRKSVGIEKVGLYIPGGSAPLFSTILMLGIPAKLAGCKEIILCTPPNRSGTIHPAILYTAQLIGITKIYQVGGAQAIAAMAYGTETIPQVYKIFGPGNQFVTKAKELVQSEGIAIDMPAGPSEVLVIADETSQAEFVAADLLSQAEHGSDSQVILLSNKIVILDAILAELAVQVERLPRKVIAKAALENSRAICFDQLEDCIAFSNEYAPEHLIVASEDAALYVDQIINAGSVFLGNYSCESAGDYASGTNHTLPTNGHAKAYSGVSLDSFVRKITFQKITSAGLQQIGPAIEEMAAAEELWAHKQAVTLRLKS
ncbi:MAG: histidinol dehydrogenase [Saprospiraceae bacterium]